MDTRTPILSVYLEAGPVPDQKFHGSLLTTLAKHHDGQAKGPLERAVRREIGRIRSYLDLHSHAGKPLAVFSSLPGGIFEVHELPGNVRTELWIDDHRHLEPMDALLQHHPATVIVAADKERARIFREILGDLHEVADLRGEPIKRHRQGGIHRAPYQRRIDAHSDRNLAAVAAWLDRNLTGPAPAVYLVAPPEARASLLAHLPDRLKRAVVGDLHVALYFDSPELGARLRTALQAARA